MTTKVLLLLLTLGFLPVAATAQSMPAPTPAQSAAPAAPAMNPGGPMRLTPAQRQQFMATFRRFSEQARSIRRATRLRMLAALSAAHRALLARLAGNLAIASNPNPRAVASELDAALYPSERAAILAASRAEMAQVRALGAQIRAQMQSVMPRPPNGHGNRTWIRHGMRHRHTPTAGEILLRTVVLQGRGQQMLFMMRPGGPPPPQQP